MQVLKFTVRLEVDRSLSPESAQRLWERTAQRIARTARNGSVYRSVDVFAGHIMVCCDYDGNIDVAPIDAKPTQ